MQRVFAVLDEYRVLIRRHHCDAAIAVLTSAVRDAEQRRRVHADGRGVLRARRPHPHRRPGGEPHVPRARPASATPTTTRRSSSSTSAAARPSSSPAHAGRWTSTSPRRPASCARPSATCTPTRRRPTSCERSAPRCAGIVEDAVAPEVRARVQAGVAVAGTATQAAAIEQELEPYDPDKVHGYTLSPRGARGAARPPRLPAAGASASSRSGASTPSARPRSSPAWRSCCR